MNENEDFDFDNVYDVLTRLEYVRDKFDIVKIEFWKMYSKFNSCDLVINVLRSDNEPVLEFIQQFCKDYHIQYDNLEIKRSGAWFAYVKLYDVVFNMIRLQKKFADIDVGEDHYYDVGWIMAGEL